MSSRGQNPHRQTGEDREGSRGLTAAVQTDERSQLGALSAQRQHCHLVDTLKYCSDCSLDNAQFQTITIPGLLAEPQYPRKEYSLII